MKHRRRLAGFTLVELLVVITIIGILTGLILTGLSAARAASRRMSCANNVRQIALAAIGYESTHGRWPAGRVGCDNTGDVREAFTICPPGLTSEEKTGASGFVTLLPWLEEFALHEQIDLHNGGLWNDNVSDLNWYQYRGQSTRKADAIGRRPTIFVCPSDYSHEINSVYAPVEAATGSYALVNGTLGPDADLTQVRYFNDGMFVFKSRRRSSHVRDGLSKTTILGEVTFADEWESTNIWTYARVLADSLRNTRNRLNTAPGEGIAWQRQNGAFGSFHQEGANFAFADGHVVFCIDTIDSLIYSQQAAIDDSTTMRAPGT